MTKLRKAALGLLVAILVVLVVLWVTGVIPHMRADAATAWATWITAAIALGAAVVGLSQVREVRRTRELQAQPNVVLYTELNPAVKQYIEIVVKNFGTTPAYFVKVTVTPPLKATPNLMTIDKLADVPIPDFPILAPGQEWGTGWDFSVSRKRYQDKWQRLAETSDAELTDQEKLEKERWSTQTGDFNPPGQRFKDKFLPSRYTATVTYKDSDGRDYKTHAILDSDQFKGTTWVDIKTIHDLTKMLEKQLDEHNKSLVAIHRRLAEFGTEHDGIWIYGNGDDDEREYRRRVEEAKAEERRRLEDAIGLTRLREQARQPLQPQQHPKQQERDSGEHDPDSADEK